MLTRQIPTLWGNDRPCRALRLARLAARKYEYRPHGERIPTLPGKAVTAKPGKQPYEYGFGRYGCR